MIVCIPLMILGVSLYNIFTITIHFPHIPMWEKIGLSQRNKTTLRITQLWEDQLDNILLVIFTEKLMPRLVVHNGVCVLFDDVFLETKSCLQRFRVYWFVPLSNLTCNMYNLVLSMAGLVTYLCMFFVLIWKFLLVAMCINWSKYVSSSSRLGSSLWLQWVFQLTRCCTFSLQHPNSWTIMCMKPQHCWWAVEAPHSFGSYSGCMLCPTLLVASSCCASEMGLPCTSLSMSIHDQWWHVCFWVYMLSWCSTADDHVDGKIPCAWWRTYHTVFSWLSQELTLQQVPLSSFLL